MENKGAGQEPMEEDHGGGQGPHRVVVSAKRKISLEQMFTYKVQANLLEERYRTVYTNFC
jgi:hypothetical protein